jgi:hypothetical protein
MAYLAAHYEVNTPSTIAETLGRSPNAVRLMASKMGIARGKGGHGLWAPDDINYLIEHYPTDRPEEIAAVLDRTINAVKLKASNLSVTDSRGNAVPLELQRIFKGWEKKHCFGPVTS